VAYEMVQNATMKAEILTQVFVLRILPRSGRDRFSSLCLILGAVESICVEGFAAYSLAIDPL
jgi:hypothetical protein